MPSCPPSPTTASTSPRTPHPTSPSCSVNTTTRCGCAVRRSRSNDAEGFWGMRHHPPPPFWEHRKTMCGRTSDARSTRREPPCSCRRSPESPAAREKPSGCSTRSTSRIGRWPHRSRTPSSPRCSAVPMVRSTPHRR